MAVCPDGHDSASDDFCDVCGRRITSSPGSLAGPVPPPAVAAEPCPRCGTARSGQFCEACGYNFSAPAPSWSATPSAPPMPPAPSAPSAPSAVPASGGAQAVWTAVVSSDRDYYERVRVAGDPEWAGVPFPAYCAERQFKLAGAQMRIGRRSVSRGLDPEIDLTGPPADPGISRLHAVLIAAPDGTWSVLDPGSVNGTFVNGHDVPTGTQVPLRDGDRINLGAWTAITVHRG